MKYTKGASDKKNLSVGGRGLCGYTGAWVTCGVTWPGRCGGGGYVCVCVDGFDARDQVGDTTTFPMRCMIIIRCKRRLHK